MCFSWFSPRVRLVNAAGHPEGHLRERNQPPVHGAEVGDAVLQRADGGGEGEHQKDQRKGEEPHVGQDVAADQDEGGDPARKGELLEWTSASDKETRGISGDFRCIYV